MGPEMVSVCLAPNRLKNGMNQWKDESSKWAGKSGFRNRLVEIVSLLYHSQPCRHHGDPCCAFSGTDMCHRSFAGKGSACLWDFFFGGGSGGSKQICLHNRDKSIMQCMLKPGILCPDTITILNTLQSAQGHRERLPGPVLNESFMDQVTKGDRSVPIWLV